MYAARLFGFVSLALLATVISTSALAAAEAILSLEYSHAPAGSDDGSIVVLLNQDGHWQQLQNDKIKWRMRIDTSWNWTYAPDSAHHDIQVRASGHPFVGNVNTCADSPICQDVFWYQAPQDEPFYKNIQIPYTVVFPDDGIGVDPAGRCYSLREELLQQGKQLRDVLGNDQVIQESAMTSLWLLGEHLWVRKELQVPLTIVCKGDKQVAEAVDPYPDMALPFQVTGASLNITPGHKLEQQCPAELNFTGRIHTAGTGSATVHYRFEWPTGQKSTMFTATVNDASKGADISHQVAIPLTAAFVPGGQGVGGGVSPGAGGFAQVQQPPPPPGQLPEAVPEQSQGPLLKGATLPGNEHKNDVRLVVTSHGGTVSSPAGYHIVCSPKPRAGISGAAGMTLPAPRTEPTTSDPDRPVIRGRIQNPGTAPAQSNGAGQQPSQSPASRTPADKPETTPAQSNETDLQFLRLPASRPSADEPEATEEPARERQRRQQR